MLVKVIEEIFGFPMERIEETDDMKVKCTLCVLNNGSAVKTDNVYLVTFKGRDIFVCTSCKARINTDKRNNTEESNATDNN